MDENNQNTSGIPSTENAPGAANVPNASNIPNTPNAPQPKKKKNPLLIILAVLGGLFLLFMLIPTDDDEEDYEAEAETEQTEEGSEENQAQRGSSLPFAAESVSVGTDAKSATIMVYVNGSDLESDYGAASEDISEMIASGVGNNVNVIIQTMGTKQWQNYGIASDTAQTYRIKDGELELLRDDLGQLDCTSKDTLSEFISYCKSEFPADRYLMIFWDHGGGPVYGFGYDQWQAEDASLTISEIAQAFSENSDIRFDIVGMDCCIMASVETCLAFAPYCKYTLLSEDFESGLGWSYTKWMGRLEEEPGISTPLLGKYIVDDIISVNEEEYGGDSACMALFNESTVRSLFDAWKKYAYKNEAALLGTNYSRMHKARGRGDKSLWDLWGSDESDVTLSDYYISDILALIESIDNDSDEAKSLMSALKASVAYYGHTSDKNELTGMSVSLPYGDPSFYQDMKGVYQTLGLDAEYVDWLGKFVDSSGEDDYYDYNSFEEGWSGWGSYEQEYGCNISNGGSCEYAYDYDQDEYDYDDDDEYISDDNWIYDYDEELWYTYEDDILYLYDDVEEIYYCYDEEDDSVYYYDEDDDDWYLVE